MKFNINDKASVILTERGAYILNNYNNKLNYFCSNTDLYLKTDYKEGELFTDACWSIMHIFGDFLYQGPLTPFKDNIIDIQ